MLDAEDPGEPHQYPCLVIATYCQGTLLRAFSLSPFGWADAGHHAYVLFFAGFAWHFIVASHRTEHTDVALQADGSFPVTDWDLSDCKSWLDLVRELARRNKEGVDRLRGRPAARS
jgi:hypothetical protein